MDQKYVGIDLSHHNTILDWQGLTNSVDFVIIRILYGCDGVDRKAEYHIKKCIEHGIPFGVYYFSYPKVINGTCIPEWEIKNARRCVNFLAALKARPLFPIYYDFEYDTEKWLKTNGVGGNEIENIFLKCADHFCSTIEDYGGFAGVYYNYDYKKRFQETIKTLANKYTSWYARYTKRKQTGYDMWQRSNTYTPKWSAGKLDIDLCYTDFPDIINKKKLNIFNRR